MTLKEFREKEKAEHLNAPLFQVSDKTPEFIEFEQITTQIQRKRHSSGFNLIKIWGRKDGVLYYLGQGDVIDFEVAENNPIHSDGHYPLRFLSVDSTGRTSHYFRANFFISKNDLPFFSTVDILINQGGN